MRCAALRRVGVMGLVGMIHVGVCIGGEKLYIYTWEQYPSGDLQSVDPKYGRHGLRHVAPMCLATALFT